MPKLMADRSRIEWTDVTWNPVTGCSKVSGGCAHCYAERIDRRFRPDWRPWTAVNAPHNVRLHPERLDEPLRWRKPRRVLVNSMSDLFHEAVPDAFIDRVFLIMAVVPQHTFQILTKRPGRMRDYCSDPGVARWIAERLDHSPHPRRSEGRITWPLTNVWLGVSVENQEAADERIPILLETPAAVRFVSCEPLLGPVDLSGYLGAFSSSSPVLIAQGAFPSRLDWVIVGGESGPGARPIHPDWGRSLRDQCVAAGVPFFFKQYGEWREACAPDDPILDGGQPNLLAAHGTWFVRLGKRRSGRVLDGRTWDEMPGMEVLARDGRALPSSLHG